jgi:hypothetical protein
LRRGRQKQRGDDAGAGARTLFLQLRELDAVGADVPFLSLGGLIASRIVVNKVS